MDEVSKYHVYGKWTVTNVILPPNLQGLGYSVRYAEVQALVPD